MFPLSWRGGTWERRADSPSRCCRGRAGLGRGGDDKGVAGRPRYTPCRERDGEGSGQGTFFMRIREGTSHVVGGDSPP